MIHPLSRKASLVAVVLVLTTVQLCSAQATVQSGATVGQQGGRYGVGFASSWPTFGASGTMQISDAITAEAVLGFFGSVSNFGGRAWYRFKRNPTYDLYGYAAASVYRYDYTTFDGSLLRTRSDTESVLGLGGGAGIDVGIQTLFKDENLPPIFLNWEVGVAIAQFDHYDFSSFVFGGGIHYRFGGN